MTKKEKELLELIEIMVEQAAYDGSNIAGAINKANDIIEGTDTDADSADAN